MNGSGGKSTITSLLFWMGLTALAFYVFVFNKGTVAIIGGITSLITGTESAMMGGSSLASVLQNQKTAGG